MKAMLITALAAFAIGSGLSLPAAAFSYTPEHAFCAKTNCTDGGVPYALPLSDGAGNYYGTTSGGGAKTEGVIYRLTSNGKHWSYTRLYSFCSVRKCADGSSPEGGLIADTMGNLYGVTQRGGDKDYGVIFELSPGGGGWTYRVLYSFCVDKICTDGAVPQTMTLTYQGAASGAPYDGTSPLYGTASSGGAGAEGVVFALTPGHGRTSWSEKVIHVFCSQSNCADGAQPYSAVLVDASGNLFGTAIAGGTANQGAVFELSPNGKKWKYSVLHSFCVGGTPCADGASPIATPVMDGAGNLYGTTFTGGAGAGGQGGTVYKLTPNGGHSKLVTLHTFCQQTGCVDGTSPWFGVVIDPAGHLLGTTYLGGNAGLGLLYRLTGPKLKSFDSILYFGGTTGFGAQPLAGLAPDTAGFYYGTTAIGGDHNGGVFYRFKP